MTARQTVLVLGAGGGADVVTAHAIREHLAASLPDARIDAAGWLNPKFDHFYRTPDGWVYETPVVAAGPVVRFRRSSADGAAPERTFDSHVLSSPTKAMVDEDLWASTSGRILHLSTRHGLGPVVDFLATYAFIIAVDVGGDILYSGKDDNTVRTPLLDALTLAALRMVDERDAHVPSWVTVLGLGTDGELDASRLAHSLDALADAGSVHWLDLDNALLERLRTTLPLIEGKSGGRTLRLLVAIGDACANGDRVRPLGGRDVEPYRRWFGKIAAMPAAAAIAHNPLAGGDSYGDVARRAAALGWRAHDRSDAAQHAASPA